MVNLAGDFTHAHKEKEVNTLLEVFTSLID